jgi:hypothetical protein
MSVRTHRLRSGMLNARAKMRRIRSLRATPPLNTYSNSYSVSVIVFVRARPAAAAAMPAPSVVGMPGLCDGVEDERDDSRSIASTVAAWRMLSGTSLC